MKQYFIDTSVLPNGVTVVTDYIPEAEAVRAELNFAVGSGHDFLKPGTLVTDGQVEQSHMNGLAHFSEHMIMGAHPSLSPEDLNELLAEDGHIRGVTQNLVTGSEETFYWAEGPKENLKAYFNFIAEAIQHRAYRMPVYSNEKRRIIEEVSGNLTRPEYVESYVQRRALFGDGIQGQWFGGLPQTLDTITIDAVDAHHTLTHTAQNATFFSSGNLHHDAACRWAAQMTANLPQGHKKPRIPVSVQSGVNLQCQVRHRPESTLAITGFYTDLGPGKTYPSMGPYFAELDNCLKRDVQNALGIYSIWSEASFFESIQQAGISIVGEQGSTKTHDVVLASTGAMVKAYELMTPARFETLKRQNLTRIKNIEARGWFAFDSRLNSIKSSFSRFNDAALSFQFVQRAQDMNRDMMLTSVEKIIGAASTTVYMGPQRDDYPDFKEVGAKTGKKQVYSALPSKMAVLPPPL